MTMAIISLQWLPTLALIFLPILALLLFRGKKKKKQDPGVKLPPGPSKLPIIGNLHQVGSLPYKSLWNLSQKYGPVMRLQLGRTPAVVISSAQAFREVMKDNDLETCSRPLSVGPGKLSYNFLDVALSPYSDYWREMRKLFIFQLLSMKRVHMYWYAREEQIEKLIGILSNAGPNPVNLTELVFNVIDGIIGTVAFGRNYGQLEFKQGFVKVIGSAMDMLSSFHCEDYFPTAGRFIDMVTGQFAKREETFKVLDGYFEKVLNQHMDPNRPKPDSSNQDIVDVLIELMNDQNASFKLTREHVKAILLDVFVGGIDTSSVTTTWAFSEMLKNPRIMNKAQAEVRGIVGKAKRVEGSDIEKFTYLKNIVKETFRKHAPVPLLIPRECIKHCKISGYDVFPGTTILTNTYAVGRDPKCWKNPDEFFPERFENSDVDFKGAHFELVPFGAGRRICPGLAMGTTAVLYTLANLLYGFDYELPNGMKFEDFPLIETGGLTIHNKQDLIVIPKKYQWKD
ncbi:2-methylbutanal oxime monooxygenase-like [Tripterygium wilfordii]|uniref:2-methylbutanal oxime monooxygenase-like n=1 Tax=Tripterygium wilfordii TaxID=458696 RepID=UPI0018F820A2|nr:2-methylbutanal oxime monooxygenase-like [Tripterygium wilfordii]